jgi:NADH dehydrogenase [ubiquinone] 1 alpha subcomplex assembly factor 5
VLVFDRPLLRQRRDRVAEQFAAHRFLFDEVGARLLERLPDIKRCFPAALNFGCHDGALTPQLATRAGAQLTLQCELSGRLSQKAYAYGPVIQADEEFVPFAPQSFNLIVSNLSLHWVNDLPGTLIQLARCLRPDGLLLATMLGGETLFELRRCLMEAELEATGGLAPRLSPLTDIKDAGALLQRAGFALPAVDRETITVTYTEPIQLLYDLRAMGAGNASLNRPRTPLRRAVLHEALRRYKDLFSEKDGRVLATFEILALTGWAPHESQQKPLARGSAQHSLADALSKGSAPTAR